MTYSIILSCLLGASDPEPSCVFLLHGDGDSVLGSTLSPAQPIDNHGATTATGKFGKAVRFDGEKAYLDCGQFFGRGFSFPQQTISIWVRPERDGKEEGIVGSQDEPGPSSWRWSLVRHADGTIGFQIYDNAQAESPRREARSTAPVPVNVWTHVAAVVDTKERAVQLYLNGERAGSDQVRSNHPYGKLIVGHSRGGSFQGSVDELAILERALTADEIAALAKRTSPLPDIVPREWSGFWLRPQGDRPFLGLWHSDLPDSYWVLRVTEYAYFDPKLDRNVSAQDVAWTVSPDRKSAQFQWDAAEELKRQVGLDFWGEYKADGDHLDFTITGKNVGREAWDRPRLSLVCLISGGAPGFVDYEAQRTFVRRGEQFVTMSEIVGGKLTASPYVRHVGEPRRRPARLAACRQGLSRWQMGTGIGGRPSGIAVVQFPETDLVHSLEPRLATPPTGRTDHSSRPRYLLKGTLDDLWRRYSEDFEKR